MRRFSYVILCFSMLLGAVAAASTVTYQAEGLRKFKIEVSTPPSTLAFPVIRVGKKSFAAIDYAETKDRTRVGEPAIPRMHRLLAVDPDKQYTVEVRKSDKRVLKDIDLYPVQPDYKEGSKATFVMDQEAYAVDRYYGAQGATLGAPAKIGPVTVLPLSLTPIEYNPVKRELVIWRSLEVTVTADGNDPDGFLAEGKGLTSFQREQLRQLVLNGKDVTKVSPKRVDKVLVVATAEMADAVSDIAQLYRSRDLVIASETVSVGMSSRDVRELIETHYEAGDLDHVVFLGDEDQVSLYSWSGVPGDVWYSYLEGSDYYADVGLGRIPAKDAEEAARLVAKTASYLEIKDTGYVNKKVMLVAHRENYPGKYTANMERIRQAPNPRELVFTTQYGGEEANNGSVIDEANTGYAIINYRGHGSDTSWSGWGRDRQSFGSSEIAELANEGEGLSVFFDVTCNNGAVQRDYRSIAENLLLHGTGVAPYRGAVAVLGSTLESYTETNHDFNEYIFEHLQTGEDLSLGTVIGTANNRLVRDNGGRLPYNVKLYILFGDPNLSPWIR